MWTFEAEPWPWDARSTSWVFVSLPPKGRPGRQLVTTAARPCLTRASTRPN